MEVDSYPPKDIDHARFQPVTDAKRQHPRDNGLSLYCGNPGHVIRHCPVLVPRTNSTVHVLCRFPDNRKTTMSGCCRSHAIGCFSLPTFSVLPQVVSSIRRIFFATKSLLDSRASTCFNDILFVCAHHIPTIPTYPNIFVEVIDDRISVQGRLLKPLSRWFFKSSPTYSCSL